MSARTEWIDLRADDGTSLRAFVARPDGPATRGLLVFQEAFGVNAHIRDVTGRFADEGFLAISPELFHRTAPGFECGYSDFALATPHLQAITAQGLDAGRRELRSRRRRHVPLVRQPGAAPGGATRGARAGLHHP